MFFVSACARASSQSCLLPQAAWRVAEQLSDASGHPWTDRYGVRRNEEAEPVGIMEVVLRQWCRSKGIPFEQGEFSRAA